MLTGVENQFDVLIFPCPFQPIDCGYRIGGLDADTRGAAETIYLGTKDIENDSETILLDGDTFYGIDVLALYRMSKQNSILFQ